MARSFGLPIQITQKLQEHGGHTIRYLSAGGVELMRD
jgi:hypothetical protein